MTKEAIRNKLERRGYKVVGQMGGGYMASKSGRSYKAGTLGALYKLIF